MNNFSFIPSDEFHKTIHRILSSMQLISRRRLEIVVQRTIQDLRVDATSSKISRKNSLEISTIQA